MINQDWPVQSNQLLILTVLLSVNDDFDECKSLDLFFSAAFSLLLSINSGILLSFIDSKSIIYDKSESLLWQVNVQFHRETSLACVHFLGRSFSQRPTWNARERLSPIRLITKLRSIANHFLFANNFYYYIFPPRFRKDITLHERFTCLFNIF